MDERKLKVTIGKAGGTSTAKKYTISIPNRWAQEMEINEDDRSMKVTFDDGVITIEKNEEY